MEKQVNTLSGRKEFLFLYDIKMGNPNGDPDENRPRVLPDGTYYVTDVRLKRYSRDFLKQLGHAILVDNIEGRTTNLTGRVAYYLNKTGQEKAEGSQLVDILLDSFIDARIFGSSLAFKAEKVKDAKGKETTWEPKPEPKTLTGATQINMGEVLHQAESVDIHGTSFFGSDDSKTQGTFTTFYGLRYALIGFSGIANQHSAKTSHMSDNDYDLLLKSMWHGVRSAANTRTKVGQIPHLLISIEYNEGEEFQFGRLHDYVKLLAGDDKEEKSWASPEDYKVDLAKLIERIEGQSQRIKNVRYAVSPDLQLLQEIPVKWQLMDIENVTKAVE
ncbi:CRISPR-associated protein, Csh2 family [Desulforamulus reducens MI-1]|uniref:CRISPR-associated protein, Csh2 family n=1 Tax=Desulforamulus reducens (strain ATCC BAA-1160 / DSM 100696 / MI-1) TaxID=349161 RepID=A4J1X8_DESRM|nr:type I-B CRISPR-associated protein Cas7/Csh2 [Desulforamulus reducens]ABO49081.1 CRISPR-associated protein, Csh2 family [Desulforamulus reducens MI-1]